MIRLGTFHSGGLVARSLLPAGGLVYSVGVGEDVDFDLALIREVGCTVLGVDPTPRSQTFINEHRNLPPEYTFEPVGLDVESGVRCMYFPKNTVNVSMSLTENSGTGSVECDFLSLRDLMRRRGDEFVDLLRMNIEGAEYAILEHWIESGYEAPVGQMWVEFHPYRTDGDGDREAAICRGLARLGWLPIHDNRFNVLFLNLSYHPLVLRTPAETPRQYQLLTNLANRDAAEARQVAATAHADRRIAAR